jgi:hypothetical protein
VIALDGRVLGIAMHVLASCFFKRMPSKVFLCDGSGNRPERYEQGVLPAGVQKRAAHVGKEARQRTSTGLSVPLSDCGTHRLSLTVGNRPKSARCVRRDRR